MKHPFVSFDLSTTFHHISENKRRRVSLSMANTLLHPLRGLLIAQFCGAFNDNAWKLMVALLAIRQATAHMAPGPELETAAQTQTTLAFVIFTLPLVLAVIRRRHLGRSPE